jgi:trehalose 6-phosphate synthase/phosphatase
VTALEEQATGRLLLVSNRLPVTARVEKGELELTRSSGGLASGLKGAHEKDSYWIGWPGELPRLTKQLQSELDDALEEMRIVPVYLERSDVKGFYEDVSNGMLWPVLHYRIDQLPLHPKGWDTYERVSGAFAEAVIAAYQPGDTIWIHDYHLLLVPGLVRKALPDAKIGFFLHIPFPAPDVFRVLPWCRQILESLLACDLVGFHVQDYAEHFQDACRIVLGADQGEGTITHQGRTATVGAFPLGIDTQFWPELAASDEVQSKAAAIRAEAAGHALIVGVDRLDYTKGLLRRLLAVEQLFQDEPSLAQKVRLIQVVFPSREALEFYSSLRRRIEEAVGRINSRYGTISDVPVHLLSRNLPVEETAALYVAADVMLVTPVRDGMNLVAKEFVACRLNEDGVLILSEFAGATPEMEGAVVINPYDIEDLAQQIRGAVEMTQAEQTARMRRLRARVLSNDVTDWTESFLSALNAAHASRGSSPSDGVSRAQPGVSNP